MPRPCDQEHRKARRFAASDDDQRNPFERDRDRVLYSSALRRLGGVTQIARAGDADVFHNRLTHTMKVAQVGRRIAEHCCRAQPQEAAFHGLDPEAVETACLAHDLGHPPFGHIGEECLDRLIQEGGPTPADRRWESDPDGFNGNAQSFRLVTKLCARFRNCPGLDLTRATLNATLKYPWLRQPDDPLKGRKWGCYTSEAQDFAFARDGRDADNKSAEAEIMDWADDIAYSVHDLEDFHRCGIIPWIRIFSLESDLEPEDLVLIIKNALDDWIDPPPEAEGRLRNAQRRLEKIVKTVGRPVLTEQYEGTLDQRRRIRTLTSQLIGRYLRGIRLTTAEVNDDQPSAVDIEDDLSDEVRFLKQLTRDYVISKPSLLSQQRGQQRIIADLFEALHDDFAADRPSFVPRKFHHLHQIDGTTPVRATSDCIASLTESEAYGLHGRLFGYASGSILDPIIR